MAYQDPPIIDTNQIVQFPDELPLIIDYKGWSAYKVAVVNGFIGTETDWLLSLKQPAIDAGSDALEAAQEAREATESSITATQLAAEATESAQESSNTALSSASFASAAGAYANEKGSLALQNAELASSAAQNAGEKANLASSAAQTAVTSASQADAARDAATTAANTANAARGWTPVYALITDGVREVQRLVDYEGGTGSKPTANINSYVGATGFTTVIANAKDIKGPQGLAGVSKLPAFVAGVYASGSQFTYGGKVWETTAATTVADIPGASANIKEVLTGYSITKKDLPYKINLAAKIVEGYVTSNGVLDTGGGVTAGAIRTDRIKVNDPTEVFTFDAEYVVGDLGSKILVFFNSANVKLSNVNITSVPYVIAPPAGTDNFVFNIKNANETRIPKNITLYSSVNNFATQAGTTPLAASMIIETEASKKSIGEIINDPLVKRGVWNNLYPNVISKLPKFIQKLAYGIGGTAELKIKIIMLGNSIFARHEHTSVLNVDPTSNPPTLITKNFGAYMWENLKGNKPTYSRFDKVNGLAVKRFTEEGAWISAVDLGTATWDDTADISNVTRRSTDPLAAFSYVIPPAITYYNLIDRLDLQGAQSITVSVTQGSSVLMARLEGETVWNEANGYIFSQRNPTVSTGSGIGNTKYQRRIEFKKVGTGIGVDIAIKVAKTVQNSDALMYWGIEEVTGNKPYVQLVNVARGGHTLTALKSYIQHDVISRKPNLVILEIPLLNMIPLNSTMEYNINELQDFIWGDRVGFINPLSLKVKSNNWTDFEVIIVIPHYGQFFFNADGTFAILPSGYTAEEIYTAVKGYIYSRGDIPFIDMSTAFSNEIKK